MLFRTIKNTTTMLTVVAICLVCTAVLVFSIEEYESLYLESTLGDLDGLSENMASDLVSLMATDPDTFEITTTLLRLDRYENVKYAVVFDQHWQQLNVYFGSTFTPQNFELDIQLETLKGTRRGAYCVKAGR